MFKISLTILFFVISSCSYSQIVDGRILNTKESAKDPYIKLLRKASRLDQKGKNINAQEILTEAIKMRPQEAIGYMQRGDQNLKLEDYDAAIDDFSKFTELTTKDQKHFGHLNLGRSKLALRNFEEALSEFDLALNIKSDLGIAYYFKGLTLIELNQKDSACQTFKNGMNLGDKKSSEAILKYCK